MQRTVLDCDKCTLNINCTNLRFSESAPQGQIKCFKIETETEKPENESTGSIGPKMQKPEKHFAYAPGEKPLFG